MNVVKMYFGKLIRNEYYQLFLELMVSFAPLFLTALFQYIINMTPIVFAGQMGRVELDGVSLSVSIIHIFGTSVGYGLCYACDSLFSQAYGSSNKKKTGLYLQKSVFIALLFPFPIIAFLLNIDHLLLLLGQDPRICEISSIYITTYLPAIPFHYCYYILGRYMQNQDKMWPPFLTSLVGVSLNIISLYIAVYILQYGYQALAVCMVFTYIIMFSINFLYILISKFHVKTWPGWTSTALYDWDEFLRLACPGIAYALFEQINWEAEIFMSGYMGIVPMAVHSVLSQTGVVTCALYSSLGISTNVKIGQYNGAREPAKVRKICVISVISIIAFASIISLTILILHNIWPKLFTSDELIQSEVSKLIAYYGIYYLPESIDGVYAGILRGYNKHNLLMWLAFGNMYLVGLPTAALLGFLTPLKVTGLWIGNTCGLTSLMIACTISILIINRKILNSEKTQELKTKTNEENGEDDEETPLVLDTDIRELHERFSNSNYKIGHTRMPSHGTMLPNDLHKIRKSMEQGRHEIDLKNDQRRKSIFIKRLATLIICLILTFIGMIIRFAVRPNYSVNQVTATTGYYNYTTSSIFEENNHK